MLQAVIFDLDGTMVDTEKLWGEINHRLAARYGTVFDASARVRMMGRRDHESLSIFREHHGIAAPVEELIQVRRALILEDTAAVRENPGLHELLALIDRLGIRKAVATSSFKEFAHKILGQFDLAGRFDAVLTAEDVAVGKPDPMMFLEAARRLGAEPARSLVIEDAHAGIEAAHAAGMFSIAVPHDSSRDHDFSKATKVCTSLFEVDEAFLRSL